ncbi:MAG: FkbM family methyltransferase [Coleofasciculus sp. C1-SOL-03]|uniref:FkbM family methyltransferase n=1 Tax=Coleofasciculus sp. C1-SOL-03 TaxID=3069522 RepID=UPI0032F288F3
MPKFSRLKQIISFTKIAAYPMDLLKLAILGFSRGHPFSSSDLISKFGRQLFPQIVIRPNLMKGLQIELNPSDLGHLISFQEIVLERCYKLELVPFKPEKVIDCGAHIGLFSLLASRAYPEAKIIAFEPNPDNAKFIQRQLQLNTLNVSLVEAAVSSQEGEAWFQSNYSNTGCLQTEESKNSDSYRVKIIDLPHFLKQLQLESLLLKVDIEGEEAQLIPALIPHLPQRCAIFFESHNGEDGWKQLSQCLTNAGFHVQQLRCSYPYVDGFTLRT